MAGIAARPERTRYRRQVEDALDEMSLTDREYHHQNLDVPLVAELVRCVDGQAPARGRVLLIGGNMLLAKVLLARVDELDIWSFAESRISGELARRVTRTVSPESLARCESPDGVYDLIVAPLILESLPADGLACLRRLRKSLSPRGRLLLATRNQSRLTNRLAALSGRRFSPRGATGSLSFSWPPLPVVHEYHRDELRELARAAGLVVERIDSVAARRPMLELEVLPVESYVSRKAGQIFGSIIPNANEVLLLDATRRPGDDILPLPHDPSVTVGLSVVDGGESLQRALDAACGQTYPSRQFEVVVIHDGRRGGVDEAVGKAGSSSRVRVRSFVSQTCDGPIARNALLRSSESDIVACIDDCCELPADWLETGVRRFGEDAGMVGGPVFAAANSLPAYLDVPGLRPDTGEREPRRTDLFPIYNAFYRREAALALDGFDEGFQTDETIGVGWDTELAWRLQRLGWQARFQEELGFGRRFPSRGGLNDQRRIGEELPAFYARVPELRPTLIAGLFASRSTLYFDMALAGSVATLLRRNRLWLLLGLPWLGQLSKRFGVTPGRWLPSLKMGARIGAAHGSWLAGLLKGSIKARRPVL